MVNFRNVISNEKFIVKLYLVPIEKCEKQNSKVCPFSLGLRNCVGKRLAQMEYFLFSAQLVHKFQISCNEEIDLEPISHPTLLAPQNTNLVFYER